LILDLSTENVNQDVEELGWRYFNLHMDYLSLKHRKQKKAHIPAAEAIIEEIKEFNVWTKHLKTRSMH
jgi:glutamyl-tRNA reductase